MPLLERDRPLADLLAATERAIGGGGGGVVVVGEAGIGKTALLHALAADVSDGCASCGRGVRRCSLRVRSGLCTTSRRHWPSTLTCRARGFPRRRRGAANFAEVDRLLSGLRTGSMSWAQASNVVFTGHRPGPYFVGYEMAKAIDRRHGAARIALLLQQHPAAFFRAYIDLYRENPSAVPAKFSKETEADIDSIPLQ